MKKFLLYTFLVLTAFTFELNASCTEEQKVRLIMNNVSQSEINRICGSNSVDTQQTQSSHMTPSENYDYTNPKKSKSGFEMRIGVVSGNGTGSVYVDDITIAEDLDTETSGVTLQLGIIENNSYIYFGLQASEEKQAAGASSGDLAAFLFGAEFVDTNNDLGFLFGGEFGFGAQSYSNNDEFSVVIFEPYVGIRFNIFDDMSVNAKIGFRGKVMSASTETSYGTSNAEIYDYSMVTGISIGFLTE